MCAKSRRRFCWLPSRRKNPILFLVSEIDPPFTPVIASVVPHLSHAAITTLANLCQHQSIPQHKQNPIPITLGDSHVFGEPGLYRGGQRLGHPLPRAGSLGGSGAGRPAAALDLRGHAGHLNIVCEQARAEANKKARAACAALAVYLIFMRG